MPEASPSSKLVEFKGGKISVMNAYLRETDAMKLADALHVMLGGMPDFFSGEAAVLDFRDLAVTPDRIDWTSLLSMLRRYQVQPIAVRNLPDHYAASARQAGLALLTGEESDGGIPAAPPPPRPTAQPAPQPVAPVVAAPAANTMVFDRPLRSGQQIYARDTDLVLLAGVSHGAEVIADGSIHCYGPLRGRALAGARGNASARIFSMNFGPELISVAGVYRTFERGIPEAVGAKPAQVRLGGEGDKQNLVVEPISLG